MKTPRRHERIRRLCLRLWRRRGLPPSKRWLSKEEVVALAENALRSCGTLHEDDLDAMFRWAEETRLRAVMLEETIRGRFTIDPRGGDPAFGVPPDAPKKGERYLTAGEQAVIRRLLEEQPSLSAAKLADLFAAETGRRVSRQTVKNYRDAGRGKGRGGPL